MTTVAVLVYPGLTALDALGPYEVLHGHPDIDLQFVWKEVGPIVTDSGVLVIGATRTLAEMAQPDVLLVPGSAANTATLMADGQILQWLQRAHAHTRLTTSVCTGALILAAAGILEGHPATTHWMAVPMLSQFGAEPRPDERIVRSGKIITAAGVSAGIDMALYLLAELYGAETAQVRQLLIEYDPQPPFATGHVSKAPPAIVDRAKREMRQLAANPRDLISFPKILARQWLKALKRA